jgi:hypothetical protein
MLIKRMKGIKVLDLPYNICWLCSDCHHSDGRVNGRKAAEWFWEIQCQRYSERIMREWLNNLPLKIIPLF